MNTTSTVYLGSVDTDNYGKVKIYMHDTRTGGKSTLSFSAGNRSRKLIAEESTKEALFEILGII